MRVLRSDALDAATLGELLGRSAARAAEALEAVRPILEAVRRGGDAAVLEYSLKFDGVEAKPLLLDAAAIRRRASTVDGRLRQALALAAANVEAAHRAQQRVEAPIEPMPGVRLWREARPIQAVGLYVPGGTAALPSTALMLAVPAQVAGCPRRVLATPPGPDGGPNPLTCAAAELAGIEHLYCAGGAQAVAALAFGTESLAPVHKIFGPGNRFVAAAKQLVSIEPQGPAIDLLAGPSELLVIADGSASADVVAADLLAQAEHDADAVVTLLATSASLVDAVLERVQQRLEDLPRAAIARAAMQRAAAIVVGSLTEAVELANRFAPEHLALHVHEPAALCPAIHSAGAVFVGELTPEAAGDYATGSNHTLPTGRAARHSGGLSLDAFQRWVSFQQLDAQGLAALAPAVCTLARAEGLEAHARSVEAREALL
jgi:histidinol dehydrogenase